MRVSRHSRERDDGDRYRRDSDRGRDSGRARSRDRHTDSRKPDSDQPANLPGPPSADDDDSAPAKKVEPLSLEELLRKKQEEQAVLAKVCCYLFREANHHALLRNQWQDSRHT